MSLAYLNLKPVVAAIAAWMAISAAASAQGTAPVPGSPGDTVIIDTTAPSADSNDEAALLRALATAAPAEAQRLDRQLQALWMKSGSAAMDLLMTRGRAALEGGDAVAAIEHLTALTDHAPDFAEAWHLRASAYFEAGLLGPAVADLGRALTLNPNNYNAIFGLGAILETLDDTERAHAAYLRAKAIHPNHEEVTKALERLEPRVKGKSL